MKSLKAKTTRKKRPEGWALRHSKVESAQKESATKSRLGPPGNSEEGDRSCIQSQVNKFFSAGFGKLMGDWLLGFVGFEYGWTRNKREWKTI